jgi:hypothetical protein
MLESLGHPVSSFVTLTYSEEAAPAGGSLSPDHWREFSKGIGYRYFGVGEYGERTARPHYHVVLFGADPLTAERLATERWPYGFVHVGDAFSLSVARYVAAYTVKKMTRADDDRLEGRVPEFARMSRRPAIGKPGLSFLLRWLATPVGVEWMATHRDVPNVIKVGKGIYPVGRTLIAWMRELCDIPADDPLRRESREADFRLVNMDEVAKAMRERKRYANYDVLKARQSRRIGLH